MERSFNETFADKSDGHDLCCYVFYEVNYGNLSFTDELIAAGIPFNSDWERGNGYGPGCNSLRFTDDGVAECKEIYDSERSLDIFDLLQKLDNYQELKEFIELSAKHIAVLPWDNQERNAKLYLTRKLIEPK